MIGQRIKCKGMTKEEAYQQASFDSLAASTKETRQDVIYRAMDIWADQKNINLKNKVQEKDKELENWKKLYDSVDTDLDNLLKKQSALESENRNLQISIATLQKDLDSVYLELKK